MDSDSDQSTIPPSRTPMVSSPWVLIFLLGISLMCIARFHGVWFYLGGVMRSFAFVLSVLSCSAALAMFVMAKLFMGLHFFCSGRFGQHFESFLSVDGLTSRAAYFATWCHIICV